MKDIKKRASDDIQVKKMFEMFAIERMLTVTYYVRRGKESAVVPKPQSIRDCRNQKQGRQKISV
jgi:hypothetical protein